jgi:hypothetical protein
MNQVLIDNSLIGLAILITIVMIRAARNKQVSFTYAFFLLFPSLLIFLNMWAHTVAVIIVNIKWYLAGTFHYDFAFYSLLLFGFTFIYLSGLLVHYCRQRIRGNRGVIKRLVLLNVLIAILFLPVGFLNPIGFLPVIAAFLSIVTIVIGNVRIIIAGRRKAGLLASVNKQDAFAPAE